MSTIDEMLDEQLEIEENPICTIDKLTRKINMHEECKFFGVERDKKVERIKFECAKEVGDENVDLMQCKAFIAYENANGEPGLYEVKDMTTEGNMVHFSWLFDEDVTLYKGDVKFIFYACKLNGDEREVAWNTIPAEGHVEEGLDAIVQIVERSPAIIESMLVRIANLEKGGVSDEQIAQAVDDYLIKHPIEVPGGAFYVTIDHDDAGRFRANKTNAEIYEAYEANCIIEAKYVRYLDGDRHFALKRCTNVSAEFVLANDKSLDGFIIEEVNGTQKVNAYSNNYSASTPSENTGNGIPAGGKTGQILCKQSDTDYDVAWVDFVVPEQYGLITYDQDKTITIT